MMEGIASMKPPGVASHEGSKPSQRVRNQSETAAPVPQSGNGGGDGAAPAAPPPQPTVDPQVTERLAARLEAALSNVDGDFSVSVDGDSGMVVVRILDTTTGEIVKQVPPQELMDADISMERIIGLLVDDEA